MRQALLRKAAAVAILVALCMAVLLGIVAPAVTGYLENRSAILLAQERLERIGARLIDPDSLRARRAALEAIPDQTTGLLKVGAEGEIAGRVENHLRTFLNSRGAEVLLVRPVGTLANDEGVRFARAHISLQLPRSQVLQVISALEAGPPSVFFETARLRPSDRRRGEQSTGALELTGTIRVYVDLSEQSRDRS